MPDGLALDVDWDAWTVPPLFRLIQEVGEVPEDDMRRTFNLGVGLVIVVSADAVERALTGARRARRARVCDRASGRGLGWSVRTTSFARRPRYPSAMTPTRLAVLGAGSWGTALAISLAESGHAVTLWARRPEAADEIRETRENAPYLPGAPLPASIVVTSDLEDAVDGAAVWIVAVPSQTVRDVMTPLADRVAPGLIVASVAKGIENGTLLTTSAVLREVLPSADPARLGVLYGPSHAEEVALGRPTSVVASFPDAKVAAFVQALFMRPALRVYANTDLVGVEIGGSVKNVMAVAAGMADGLGLGDNAKAALVTRGLAEITRLGLAMGADAHTFAGLAGLGDLVVTCFSGTAATEPSASASARARRRPRRWLSRRWWWRAFARRSRCGRTRRATRRRNAHHGGRLRHPVRGSGPGRCGRDTDGAGPHVGGRPPRPGLRRHRGVARRAWSARSAPDSRPTHHDSTTH